jgi:hypothetical protein
MTRSSAYCGHEAASNNLGQQNAHPSGLNLAQNYVSRPSQSNGHQRTSVEQNHRGGRLPTLAPIQSSSHSVRVVSERGAAMAQRGDSSVLCGDATHGFGVAKRRRAAASRSPCRSLARQVQCGSQKWQPCDTSKVASFRRFCGGQAPLEAVASPRAFFLKPDASDPVKRTEVRSLA